MKVGIITMISDNYGNRLQNYALQEVLCEIGNEVETLNNPWEDSYNPYREKLIANLKKLIFFLTKQPERYAKKIRFEQFNHQHINFSELWLNKESDRLKAAKLYDIFICGSDQVWNSEAKEITGKYFADFANEDQRGSYAASFGIDEIIPARKEEFAEYLSGMKYISVREQMGVSIVKELLGKSVSCHLDPTFLLTAEKWDKVASRLPGTNEKYIFCYFLGKISTNILNEIEKYRKEKKLKVYMICSEQESRYNTVGPDCFITLIKNAEFILTDSFHGTVFSIIYEKPFYTFSRSGVREGMSSRVISILDLLNLKSRFEPGKLVESNIYNIDFKEAQSILREERERSLDYLRIITKTNI